MAYPSPASLPIAFLSRARSEILTIATTISYFEPVTLLARLESLSFLQSHFQTSEQVSRSSFGVKIQEMDVDHCWIRDSGPVFVRGGEDGGSQATGDVQGVDFNFNNWGNKHPIPPLSDSTLSKRLLNTMRVRHLASSLVSEGGALETDGAGTLLATKSSIINPNRNPSLNAMKIERCLKESLSVRKVIWLKGVKDEDSTDCHVDALARFADDRLQSSVPDLRTDMTVLLSRPHKSRLGSWMQVYEEARAVLQQETTAEGRKIRVVDLQEPAITPTMNSAGGDNAVPSYANFAWVNGGIVIPSFGEDEADGKAFEVFEKCFPGREIAQVRITTLPIMGGGIHCVTLPVPL